MQLLKFAVLARLPRFGNRLAPFHLLHQELGGHGGVGVERRIDTAQLKQVMPAGERALEGAEGFVDVGRPLHRLTLLGVGQVGEAVGMHPGLDVDVGLLQLIHVDGESRNEAEQREVILLEVDHLRR